MHTRVQAVHQRGEWHVIFHLGRSNKPDYQSEGGCQNTRERDQCSQEGVRSWKPECSRDQGATAKTYPSI